MWWTAFPTHQSGSVHCCNIKGFVRLIHAAYVTNKSYHLNMIMQLPSVCFSQFAAVQFSSFPRKVFDFNDFIAGRALDKLLKEPLMGSLSSTHKALTFVLWVQCQHIWFFFPIDEGLLFYSKELYFFTFFFLGKNFLITQTQEPLLTPQKFCCSSQTAIPPTQTDLELLEHMR